MFLSNQVQWIAAACFLFALLHSFIAPRLLKSIRVGFWRFLGEVELVFILWSIVFGIFLGLIGGGAAVSHWILNTQYDEAIFVGVILLLASTRPILYCVEKGIDLLTRLFTRIFRTHSALTYYGIAFTVGTWLGSLVTEPAAMTVIALLIYRKFLKQSPHRDFKYATLGLLFVNISIGGVLTSFAAPPVIMVAKPWGLTSAWMFEQLGWKAMLASFISTLVVMARYHKNKNKYSQTNRLMHPISCKSHQYHMNPAEPIE
jgi:hypothetical protein